jgi:hypothetical protein
MTDLATELKKAGAAYKRARTRADQIMDFPREQLTEKVRAAYADGMRKADILRAIDHVWSRQWLDDTVRDITPPGGKPGPHRKTTAADK